ncbi:NAD(P)-dependent oxidoreductase [Nocardia sp. BSTN01]|uniref:NAD(P)-dependent oxidoreductase n=1 Tax=Nocardia sp. BSTN01 TaxID=2783665 RepID=UPI00188F1E27|nr:NAD(P)-binding domain-containing protein [Nocardia sp. BSTN01]MBF4999127.1 NAD(P)-dependent oxidoreductase [Nocardia sp. BSTN01]
MSDQSVVAVLGAGIMANTVANTLAANGFELRRYNRTTSAIEGPAIVCASPAQAAEDATAIWSFVHDDTASRAVWFGTDGALTAVEHGAVVIESSTLSAEYADYWIRTADSLAARPVLAPVTGSRPAAAHGTLVAFVAGAPDAIDAANPLLRMLSRDVIRVGSAADAARLKLVNNALAATILTGLAEALTAAAALGLDRDRVAQVWRQYGWAAPVANAYTSAMLSGEHELSDCSLKVIAKDLAYTLAGLGAATPPVLAAVADRFQRALAANLGDLEMSAIIETYKALS